MTRRLLIACAVLATAGATVPPLARAQTFKVEKFDIKGDGGTDYVAAESGTGRVFVSRGTHVMVVDGATGKVLGDIRTRRACTAPAWPRKPATASRPTAATRT